MNSQFGYEAEKPAIVARSTTALCTQFAVCYCRRCEYASLETHFWLIWTSFSLSRLLR